MAPAFRLGLVSLLGLTVTCGATTTTTDAAPTPTPTPQTTYLEQGTICTGLMDATEDDVWPLIEDMCWNVTGGMHTLLPKAKPDLHAWTHQGTVGSASSHVTLVAVDGDAAWKHCYGSFRTIFDDCAKDGKAPLGLRRYGDQLYIIDKDVPQVPELTGAQ